MITKVRAQEEKKLFMRGYVKDLVTYNFNEDLDRTLIDNLVHNRLNLSWFPNQHIIAKLGLRTRMFTGDFVQLVPFYGELIDSDNDHFDLSWTILDRNSVVVHSILDRAYLSWNSDNLEISVGRQRINWGLNLIWNPNDIFNTYSFFDFDYEERQGSDAIRVQWYTGVASSVEFAIKAADSWNESTAAVLWKLNKWDYDFQWLSGISNDEFVVGLGWAGRLGNAGFKGESTAFIPQDSQQSRQLLASISLDYSFPNALYVHSSVLYNSLGADIPVFNAFNTISREQLSVKSISPYAWSTLLQVTYSFHALVTGGVASIYYPGGSDDFYVGPSVTISAAQNFDLDVIGQFFATESTTKLLFTRLKWSF